MGKSTTHHQDLIMQEKKGKDEVYVEHLRSIFQQLDDDGSGEVSLLEIEEMFNDEGLHHLLQALDISAFDARSMFKLLDIDGSSMVDIDEFCTGCLKLKGEAKSFDVQCLMYESQRLHSKVTTLMGNLEESVVELKDVMSSPKSLI